MSPLVRPKIIPSVALGKGCLMQESQSHSPHYTLLGEQVNELPLYAV